MEINFVAQNRSLGSGEWRDETNIPTSQSKKGEDSWILSPYADSRRQGGDKPQARTGEKKVDSGCLREGLKIDVIGADKRLTKNERIIHARDYEKIRSFGQRYKAGPFIVIVAKNELGYRRIGISVSKKAGKSVVRNRLRRVIKEYFRTNKEKFPTSSDILFICRESVESIRPAELAEIIEPLFDRLA